MKKALILIAIAAATSNAWAEKKVVVSCFDRGFRHSEKGRIEVRIEKDRKRLKANILETLRITGDLTPLKLSRGIYDLNPNPYPMEEPYLGEDFELDPVEKVSQTRYLALLSATLTQPTGNGKSEFEGLEVVCTIR